MSQFTFTPVPGRVYADTVATAKVGEWLLRRDQNENRMTERDWQVEVVEVTKGRVAVAQYGATKWVSKAGQNARKNGHGSWLQGALEWNAEQVHAVNCRLIGVTLGFHPYGIDRELAAGIAGVIVTHNAQKAMAS